MKKVEASARLKQLILAKEAEHRAEGRELREHFFLTYESLKPVNIIRNTVKDIFASPEIKNNLVNTALGVVSGLVAKKIFTGKSTSTLTKMFGDILELAVASGIASNADEIRAIGNIIIKKLVPEHNGSPVG